MSQECRDVVACRARSLDGSDKASTVTSTLCLREAARKNAVRVAGDRSRSKPNQTKLDQRYDITTGSHRTGGLFQRGVGRTARPRPLGVPHPLYMALFVTVRRVWLWVVLPRRATLSFMLTYVPPLTLVVSQTVTQWGVHKKAPNTRTNTCFFRLRRWDKRRQWRVDFDARARHVPHRRMSSRAASFACRGSARSLATAPRRKRHARACLPCILHGSCAASHCAGVVAGKWRSS